MAGDRAERVQPTQQDRTGAQKKENDGDIHSLSQIF